MSKLMKPDLHIDADILAYRAAAATDGRMYIIEYSLEGTKVTLREKYKKDADKVVAKLEAQGHTCSLTLIYEPEPLKNAITIMKKSIVSLETLLVAHTKDIGSLHYYLSRGGSFREKIYKGYKVNRKDKRRPTNLEGCKQWLIDQKCAWSVPGKLEADDLMAMRKGPDDIICSIDKDLLQVPGYHFNWVRNEFKEVSEEEGCRSLYMQMLTGDSTDGIPGIKGIGPVGAKKLLVDVHSEFMMYCVVLREYLLKTPRDADEADDEFYAKVMQLVEVHAKLLYLLRSPEDSWEAPHEDTTLPV